MKTNLLKTYNNSIDEYNYAILLQRFKAFELKTGPRIGDFLVLENGNVKRFTHDWGAEIQTTLWGEAGSFYIGGEGCVSFSGGLDCALPKSSMELTTEVKMGSFWFFYRNEVKAHNGLNVLIPCAVWCYTATDYQDKLIHPEIYPAI
jgi:hypothetical protein